MWPRYMIKKQLNVLGKPDLITASPPLPPLYYSHTRLVKVRLMFPRDWYGSILSEVIRHPSRHLIRRPAVTP